MSEPMTDEEIEAIQARNTKAWHKHYAAIKNSDPEYAYVLDIVKLSVALRKARAENAALRKIAQAVAESEVELLPYNLLTPRYEAHKLLGIGPFRKPGHNSLGCNDEPEHD